MNEHQRETAFLRQCIRYDDTAERHRLEDRIVQLQRDERCTRRAVWLMALLAAMAMAGLGYSAVLMADYPLNVSQLTSRYFVKAMCILGMSSLVCLFGFLILGVMFRKELDQRREDCRRLALKVLESRLGQPDAVTPASERKARPAPAIAPQLAISDPDGEQTTGKNELQLNGFVHSRGQKNRAGDLAKGVEGIHEVENNGTVKESAN